MKKYSLSKTNGKGIAPQFHHRSFGLFDKLDPKSEGTGVGLALVRRIIEVHGGVSGLNRKMERFALLFHIARGNGTKFIML